MSTEKTYLTFSPTQTKKLGEVLAGKILKKELSQKALLIGLEGGLGAGKTAFVQGLAQGFGIKEKILSPTFILVRKFQISTYQNIDISKYRNFYHIDCYRIEKPKELLDLGFNEIVSNPKNIVCIEWADKIRGILPKNILWLKFEFRDKTQRRIVLTENI